MSGCASKIAALVSLCLCLAAACGDQGGSRARASAPARPQAQPAHAYALYVSNEDSNDISIIDAAQRRVITTVPVGKRPRGLRVAPDGARLYVALSGSPKAPPGRDAVALAPDRTADGIAALDLRTNAIVGVLPSGRDPETFDLLPDGSALYASNEETAQSSRIALPAGRLTHSIAVGEEPEGVAVRPDGRFVYVTSEASDLLSVVETSSQRAVSTVPTGRRPRAVVFTRDGTRAFVTNELSASVTVIDARHHRALAEIAIPPDGAADIGPRPMGACVSPDGTRLYVSNGRGGTVAVIDVPASRVVSTIAAVGTRPWGIALSPDGGTLFTANGPSNDVSVIDVASTRVVARIPAGSSPWGIAVGARAAPPASTSTVPSAQLPAGGVADGEWTMPAKDFANTRFSTLRQVDARNVARLAPTWAFKTGLQKGHEAAPLVVGDTMYVVTPYPNRLYALDLSKRGAVRWVYEPLPLPAAQGVACCDVVNRGAAYDAGRIFFNTLDGQTVAVDAGTGRALWKTQLGDINKGETMTMAPLVVKGRVLVGNSGGEYGVRGWLTALDAASGAVVWRAHSTGPDKDVLIGPSFKPYYAQDRGTDLGVNSWPPGRWQMGGGTVWGFVSYDPELDLVFYGTGNPGPWNPEQRPGDNKWTAGIFARRPATGEALWFYQWSPHDLYDHDGINESIVADLTIAGQARKVLLHAERNGYVYVLDRASGQVLSADPFVHITSTRGVDLASGRLTYVTAKKPKLGEVVRGICPASPGAKDWSPAAFSSETGLLYVPVNNLCQDVEGMEAHYISGTPYLGATVKMYAGPGGKRGRFMAWDPIARKKVWEIEERFPVWSGALASAGDLVFYGTMDGWFKAVHARTGALLWKHKTASGIVGQPITYLGPDGRQYVAVLSGVGGWAGAVVSGKLDVRDQSASLGLANAMRDLPDHTQTGGAVLAFALP